MSLIQTTNGRIIFKKAESVMLVPYIHDIRTGNYILNTLEDVYDISSVVGDSIVIEQSDGNTTTKNNEFKSEPLLESVSGTKYAFTAQCIDLQNSVLRSVFGAMTGVIVDDVPGLAAFQADFGLMYVLVRIRFKDKSLPDVFLPKVQLNSRLFINQLKTRTAQGNIAGTANQNKVAIDRGEYKWLIQFRDPIAWTTRYCPNTPVLFVPRDKTPFFFAWEKDDVDGNDTWDRYSTVDFESGTIQHDILINERAGNWRAV